MQRLMITLTVLMMMFVLSSNSFAQDKGKLKTKAKITKPVSNPTSVGETENDLSKTKNVQNKTQSAVFEPNDVFTRAKVMLSLRSFLLALWQGGALMGAHPGEAFYVRCDDGNNPPSERANGR